MLPPEKCWEAPFKIPPYAVHICLTLSPEKDGNGLEDFVFTFWASRFQDGGLRIQGVKISSLHDIRSLGSL